MLHIQNRTTNASCPDLRDQGYKADFNAHSAARGPRKKIYHGHLHGKGPRQGEDAVVKVFRDKPGTEESCDLEIEKHNLARKLANRFNNQLPDDKCKITFTLPMKSRVESLGMASYFSRHSGRATDKKEWVLVEENLVKLGEYQVFISKTGQRLMSDPTSLDAFLHFSYQESEGAFVMCGFQGIHRRDGYVLTTPCFHSTDHSFGLAVDKGYEGILEVFRRHQCNNLCYHMIRPKDKTPDEKKSTENESTIEGSDIERNSGSSSNLYHHHNEKLNSRTLVSHDDKGDNDDKGGNDDNDNDDDDGEDDNTKVIQVKKENNSKDNRKREHLFHFRSNLCAIGTVPTRRPSF